MAKDRANVTVDGMLLREAKALGINLSETLETSLRAKVKEEAARRWYEENKDALAAFERYVEEHGTFGERMLAEERGMTVGDLRAEANRKRRASDRRSRKRAQS